MARIRITKPIREALMDQLQARGIRPTTPEGQSILQPDPDGRGGWLTVPDADAGGAQQVIDAHDAGVIDAARDADNQQFLADVAGLKQYQGLASPTLAQTVATTKAQNRILKRVVQELRDL